jgi:hypothetical protein
MKLQNLGVTQSSAGKVANACVISISVVVKWSILCLEGQQVGWFGGVAFWRMFKLHPILLNTRPAVSALAKIQRQRCGTEHVSTVWGIRKEDGTVRYLQSRIQWLTNHTADELNAKC